MLSINRRNQTVMSLQNVEIVERKGRGHPDTMCDDIANKLSVEYCKKSIAATGTVQHHNFDKSLLAAGWTWMRWKNPTILKPITYYYGDRAATLPMVEVVPLCNQTILGHLQDLAKGPIDVEAVSALNKGSQALMGIFSKDVAVLPSNDTSAAVGYAPLSEVERLIIDLEYELENEKLPWLGRDLKFMAVRDGRFLDLTVAAAMVIGSINSADEYKDKKYELNEIISTFIARRWDGDFELSINNLDNIESEDVGDFYLTLSGLSAECGDSGQVGRGNNVLGIIPLCRPISSEAAAGKNPVSHIGRIYNHLSFRIASRIVEELNVGEATVHLVNRIGTPINEPSMINITLDKATYTNAVVYGCDEIAKEEFNGIQDYVKRLTEGWTEAI